MTLGRHLMKTYSGVRSSGVWITRPAVAPISRALCGFSGDACPETRCGTGDYGAGPRGGRMSRYFTLLFTTYSTFQAPVPSIIRYFTPLITPHSTYHTPSPSLIRHITPLAMQVTMAPDAEAVEAASGKLFFSSHIQVPPPSALAVLEFVSKSARETA